MFRNIAIPLAITSFMTWQAVASEQSEKTLILAADPWCPYNCEPGADRPGYMVEIAKAVLEPAGYEIKYEAINWARALVRAREGEYAGVIGAFHGDAPDFIFPDEPLGLSGNGIFVLSESAWQFTVPASLTNIRVGTVRGYDYGVFNIPLRDFANVQVLGGNDALERNINKLLIGRLDAVIEDISVLQYRLDQMGMSGRLKIASKSIAYSDAYIAFSPARKDAAYLAEILTTGVRRLRHIQELPKILARYGLQDWK